jgi:hypothetical protein
MSNITTDGMTAMLIQELKLGGYPKPSSSFTFAVRTMIYLLSLVFLLYYCSHYVLLAFLISFFLVRLCDQTFFLCVCYRTLVSFIIFSFFLKLINKSSIQYFLAACQPNPNRRDLGLNNNLKQFSEEILAIN